MDGQSSRRWWDAAGLLFEAGHQAQALALTMRKHEIAADLGVCKGCGRTPVAELPVFGPRCEIAVEQWRVTREAMKRLLGAEPGGHDGGGPNRHDGGGPNRAVGRVPVPPEKP
ncbi:MAG: hypothetical protein GEU94_03670 [Micromonosporaceae bacterium]|nr:hypothetical protein [Micromonosporaceae bacterium]